MQSKVAPFAATPDSTYGQHAPATPAEPAMRAPEAPVGDEADLRLVIEEDRISGSYVYKTVNRLTGEVVQQYPRDEVLRMREDAAYAAGGLIRTKA